MLNATSIANLQDEKALLVAESEINRHAFQIEFAMLQNSVSRATEAVKIGVGIYPALIAVGSLAGFLFLRKKRLSAGPSLLGKLIAGWNIFQRVRSFLAANRSGGSRGEVSSS